MMDSEDRLKLAGIVGTLRALHDRVAESVKDIQYTQSYIKKLEKQIDEILDAGDKK